jgi:hypothetical protein
MMTNDLLPARPQPLAQPLCQILEQLAQVIELLDHPSYTRHRDAHMNASVGEHVRHCLDHVQCLADALDDRVIDYDARQRGTTIETDRAQAVDALNKLRDQLIGIDSAQVNKPVQVRAMARSDTDAVVYNSTLGRELVFVLSHTIHHNAMIRAMVTSEAGPTIPPDFGYAPATIAHRQASASCVR